MLLALLRLPWMSSMAGLLLLGSWPSARLASASRDRFKLGTLQQEAMLRQVMDHVGDGHQEGPCFWQSLHTTGLKDHDKLQCSSWESTNSEDSNHMR